MAETLVAGQSGTLLDIYIKAGTVLYDPSVITYSITNVSGQFQGSGLGTRRSIGHYDASLFTVPSSGGTGSWTVTWSVNGTTKNETFTVAAPTLSEAGDFINDVEQIRRNIKIDIGDINNTLFSDYLLNQYIEKSIIRLNRALGIGITIRPTGITPGGIGQPALTPAIIGSILDGTIYPNTDEIKDLIVLQSEVLITRAEMSILRRASSAGSTLAGSDLLASGTISSSPEGIYVKNADNVIIDTKSRGMNWQQMRVKLFLDEAKLREEELKNAIFQVRANMSANSSKVVY